VTPIVFPHPQENFAAYGSRVFKSRFCFANFNVGGFGLANSSKRHNSNTKHEVFHRRNAQTTGAFGQPIRGFNQLHVDA
jgi:hypothetical protein